MLVRVLHAYSASDEAELSVQPEERLTLIEGDSEGWVRLATLDGQRQGFVPASYVMLELAGDNEGSVTSHDSHDSDGSFTTVAPSRAAQPNIIAAKALGAQLADRLAAATSRDALEESSASSGFYEPFGDLKVDECARPSTAEEEELVAPWDSVSCLGEQPSRREEASRGRGLRILPHDDERPSQAKGGVRVVRPATLQVLLGAAHAKQAALWPGAPLCAHLALYDEEGCEVGALAGKVGTPLGTRVAVLPWSHATEPLLHAKHACSGGHLQLSSCGRARLVACGGGSPQIVGCGKRFRPR